MLARTTGLILHTSVTIGYEVPWRGKVHELLIQAALKTRYILEEPAPFVLQNALQDSYVQYEINAYTNEAKLMIFTYSELHGNIQGLLLCRRGGYYGPLSTPRCAMAIMCRCRRISCRRISRPGSASARYDAAAAASNKP